MHENDMLQLNAFQIELIEGNLQIKMRLINAFQFSQQPSKFTAQSRKS